jgi:hypothetical protein
MNSSDTLQYKLRQLFLEYSPKQVYDTTLNIFKQDYAFYQSLFTTDKAQHQQQESQSQPQPQPQPHVQVEEAQLQPASIKRKEAKKVVVVRKEPEVKTYFGRNPADDSELEDIAPIAPATLLKTEESGEAKQVFIDSKQKEKEDETHAKLVAEGINPETLLTKENLKEWVEVKKYNFAYIARELVGLTQNQVRFAAKAFNIQSPITERRKRIVGGKLASGK